MNEQQKHHLDIPVGKTHIDDWISYGRLNGAPDAVLWWFYLHRLPASLRYVGVRMSKDCAAVYADHEGKRVRVVMVSRLGDVGITSDLAAEGDYQKRVFIDDLTSLSTTP